MTGPNVSFSGMEGSGFKGQGLRTFQWWSTPKWVFLLLVWFAVSRVQPRTQWCEAVPPHLQVINTQWGHVRWSYNEASSILLGSSFTNISELCRLWSETGFVMVQVYTWLAAARKEEKISRPSKATPTSPSTLEGSGSHITVAGGVDCWGSRQGSCRGSLRGTLLTSCSWRLKPGTHTTWCAQTTDEKPAKEIIIVWLI